MTSDNTRERILVEARIIFQRKGLSGARMQEIADAVGINKAMLHYYFDSKERLFSAVFEEAAAMLFAMINRVLEAEVPLTAKLRTFVDEYLDLLLEHPHIPAFVLGEVHRDPERAQQIATSLRLDRFATQVEGEVRAGRIRPTDPYRLLLDLLSLCVFPFAARPMLQGAFGLNDHAFKEMINRRKAEIPDLLLLSLEPQENRR